MNKPGIEEWARDCKIIGTQIRHYGYTNKCMPDDMVRDEWNKTVSAIQGFANKYGMDYAAAEQIAGIILAHSGDLWHSKECIACQPVIDEFNKTGDCAGEGYCDEWIREWWREEKCPACIHYWWPCEPEDVCRKEFIKPDGTCPERTKRNTCSIGFTCDDMTHYCRCERFEKEEKL